MRKIVAIVGLIYIVLLSIIVICVPLSAILLICKACNACAASWLGCCVPLLISIATTPFFTITTIMLDRREDK